MESDPDRQATTNGRPTASAETTTTARTSQPLDDLLARSTLMSCRRGRTSFLGVVVLRAVKAGASSFDLSFGIHIADLTAAAYAVDNPSRHRTPLSNVLPRYTARKV